MSNLMTTREVYEIIFERKISIEKIYQWTRNGRLPCIKLDGKYLFYRDQVEQWIRDQGKVIS